MNTRQIPNLEYPTVDSLVVESIVDGKSLDESRTCLFTSISNLCLFVEIIPNKNMCKNGISEPMLHFDNNMFLKSKGKKCKKGIIEPMLHFNNNTFLKSKGKKCKKGIIEPMLHFGNNTFSKSNKKV